MNENAKRYVKWMDEPARIRVTGRGEFPMDMLRRDCAWPASTEDACKILDSEKRTVELVAQSRRFVTRERWASFGWKVTELDDDFKAVLEVA